MYLKPTCRQIQGIKHLKVVNRCKASHSVFERDRKDGGKGENALIIWNNETWSAHTQVVILQRHLLSTCNFNWIYRFQHQNGGSV